MFYYGLIPYKWDILRIYVNFTNNLIQSQKENPNKSLNLVGFVTICFSARGERGSSLIHVKLMNSILYKILFYRVPTRVPTELETFKILIIKIEIILNIFIDC